MSSRTAKPGNVAAVGAGVSLALMLALAAPAPEATPGTPAATATDEQQTLSAAIAKLNTDIASARDVLAALRRDTADRHTKAIQRLAALRHDVRTLTADLRATCREHEALETRRMETEQYLAEQQAVTEHISQLLHEYRRAFETRISAARAQYYRAGLAAVDEGMASADHAQRLEAGARFLGLAHAYIAEQMGGSAFDGQAVNGSGRLVPGRFAEIGPFVYFATEEGQLAGLAIQRADSTEPFVFDDLPDASSSAGIRQLVFAREGSVPLDITQGAAIQLRQTEETLKEHLQKGGVIMLPLLALAVTCVVLSLYKFCSLLFVSSRGSEERVATIVAALRQGRIEAAMLLVRELRKPLGPVIAEGIEHRGAPKEHIEEIMYERILSQVPALERLLAPLAVCASVAPLLGLLGTVTGMIHTFRLITVFGTGDAKMLSSGISEALITTEVGLMVAIPALLIHAYLSRRVRKAVAATQQASIMFVNGLKLREAPETEHRQ